MDPKLKAFVAVNITTGVVSALGAIFQPKEVMQKQLKSKEDNTSQSKDEGKDSDFAFIAGLMGCAQIGRMMCGVFAWLSNDQAQLQTYSKGVFAADTITIAFYIANREKLNPESFRSTMFMISLFAAASCYFGFVRKYD